MDHQDKEFQTKRSDSVGQAFIGGEGVYVDPPLFDIRSNAETIQEKEDPESEGKDSQITELEFSSGEVPPPSENNNNAPFQLKSDHSAVATGNLPPSLQSNMEAMSGIGLNDVKVHANSSKPDQVGAHAFAQGNEIHLGPGQEKHLPHEAWHVVQQKQGRVQPNNSVNGQAINDSPELENEADKMGEAALSGSGTTQFKRGESSGSTSNQPLQLNPKRKKKNNRKKKKKRKPRNKSNAAPPQPQRVAQDPEDGWFGANTKLGKLASLFSGWQVAPDEDENGTEFLEGIGVEKDEAIEGTLLDYGNAEGEIGDPEEESGLIESIKVNLVSHKREVGEHGEAEVGVGVGMEGIEGSGELEIKYAKEGKIVKEEFFWDKESGMITTKSKGEISGFAGGKAKMEGEASFNPTDYSAAASGKASAFAGAELEGSVDVDIMVNGVKSFSGKGTLGLTAGVGFEAGFHIGWEGGSFKAGAKGKVAAGVGFSGGYELKIDPKSIIRGMYEGVKGWLGY